MAKDLGDILVGIYNYGIQDKVIHNGIVTKSPFQVNDSITGSLSGAVATITYVGKSHFDYTLSTGLKLKVGDVITGSNSGASYTISKINQLHTTISDRLYFEEAEEDDIVDLLPYVTFELGNSDTFSYYTGEYETMMLTFMAYSNQSSSTQITAIDKQINDLFNKDTELVISNWLFKSLIKRGRSKLFRDENKIWILMNNFELTVQ